jgi:hypothetical protein
MCELEIPTRSNEATPASSTLPADSLRVTAGPVHRASAAVPPWRSREQHLQGV